MKRLKHQFARWKGALQLQGTKIREKGRIRAGRAIFFNTFCWVLGRVAGWLDGIAVLYPFSPVAIL